MYGKEWLEFVEIEECREAIESALGSLEKEYDSKIWKEALYRAIKFPPCPACQIHNINALRSQQQLTQNAPSVSPANSLWGSLGGLF